MMGSDLDGLMTAHLITSTQRPATWPRVAITVTSAAPSIFKAASVSESATVGTHDCANYNVKVWTSACSACSAFR